MEAEKILDLAAKALDSKKGIDINAIKVGELTIVAEYFLIVTATSSTHVRALSEEAEDVLSKNGVEPVHIEGKSSNWVLLDYGSVLIHVFTREAREFYNLDHIWSDGEKVDIL